MIIAPLAQNCHLTCFPHKEMEIQITEENPTVCPKVKSDELLSEFEDAYVEGFEALRKGKESDSSLPSPINLNVSDAIKVRLPNLKWHKYDVIPRKMKVTNSGRTGKFLKTSVGEVI